MAQIASMEPEDTQKMSSQVYLDYYKRNAQALLDSTLQPGDTGYVDLGQDFSAGSLQDARSQDVDDAPEPHEIVTPRTPAMTGQKRDHRGNFLSSARTPASGLTAMFKTAAGGANVIGLSQVFNQTQQPSSPFPNGPRSDPVFERPSPDIYTHRTPLATSSPTVNQRTAHQHTTSDPLETYIPMQHSQELRERRRQEGRRKDESSPWTKNQMDALSDEEDSVEQQIAKRRQRERIQEKAKQGFARLEHYSNEKQTRSKSKASTSVVDLVTPASKPRRDELATSEMVSSDAESLEDEHNSFVVTGNRIRRAPSAEPSSSHDLSQDDIAVANSQLEIPPPRPLLPASIDSEFKIPESQGAAGSTPSSERQVTSSDQVIASSPPSRSRTTPFIGRASRSRRQRPKIPDTSPMSTAEPPARESSSHDIIVNSLEHQPSAPTESKGDSGFVTAPTHPTLSPTKNASNASHEYVQNLDTNAAGLSHPNASGASVNMDLDTIGDNDAGLQNAMAVAAPLHSRGKPVPRAPGSKALEIPGHDPHSKTLSFSVNPTNNFEIELAAKSKKLAPNRVLALFPNSKMSYYPATCLSRTEDGHCHIRFDDGNVTDVKEQHVRNLELLPGDVVRVDRPGMRNNKYTVCVTKDEISQDALRENKNSNTDVYGHRTALLTLKSRNSLPGEDCTITEVEVSIANIYTTGGAMWSQFRARPFDFKIDRPVTNGGLPISSDLFSRKSIPQAEPGHAVDGVVNNTASALFSGMAFVITYANDGQKDLITTTVLDNGGRILAKGFDELFDTSNSTLLTSLSARELGFTALLADSYSRRPKHIQSLALNIPCLSGQWVIDSANKGTLMPWNTYLHAAGESKVLGGAIISRTFCELTPSFANYNVKLTQFVDARTQLLKGRDILLVLRKKTEENTDLFRFLCFALGANQVRLEPKKPKIENAFGNECAVKPLVIEDETIIQSLIVGRLVDL